MGEERSERKIVSSCDIGYYNLGLASVSYAPGQPEVRVERVALVDLRALDKDLTVYQTDMEADLVRRLEARYADRFAEADEVLIEKQPPNGLVAIEQLRPPIA